MIKFQCLGCGTAHTANAKFAGKSAMCTKCGSGFRIPGLSDSPPKPAADPPPDGFSLDDELMIGINPAPPDDEGKPVEADWPEVLCPRCAHTVADPAPFLGKHHQCIACYHPFLVPDFRLDPRWAARAKRNANANVQAAEAADVATAMAAVAVRAATAVTMRAESTEDKTLDELADELAASPRGEDTPGGVYGVYGPVQRPGEIRGDDEVSIELMEDDDSALEDQSTPERKRDWRKVMLVALLLPLIGGSVYYFGFSDSTPPPKPPAVVPDDDPPAKPPPPPPAKSATPPSEEFVGPPKPPVEPIRLTADRLFEELLLDLEETDDRYRGKLMEVEGVCWSLNGTLLTFWIQDVDSAGEITGIQAVLPQYAPRFTNPENGQPIVPVQAVAAMGGWSVLSLEPPAVRPTNGRPVTVRGVYADRGRLRGAAVVSLAAPADAKYLNQTVCLTGVIQRLSDQEVRDSVTAFLVGVPTSQSRATVECRFKGSARAALEAIPKGTVVTITGKCTGRAVNVVRLDNCSLGGSGVPVSAAQLMFDYGTDIKKHPPISPDLPVIKVTAESLAATFDTERRSGNKLYSHHILEVTGVVSDRNAQKLTLKYESPTDVLTKVYARFATATALAAVPLDDVSRVTIRGAFRGLPRGSKEVILDNCEYVFPDANSPAVQKVTADYFPIAVGRHWQAIRVDYPEPLAVPPKLPKGVKPPKAPVPAARLLHYEVLPGNVLGAVVVNAGTFHGRTILGADAGDIKWVSKKEAHPNSAAARPFAMQPLRVGPVFVELGQAAKAGPTGPVEITWQPLLKLNAKQGTTWEYTQPGGGVTRATVERFFRDKFDRDCVRIVSVTTEDRVSNNRLEVAVVLGRGIGEVSRVVTLHTPGSSRVVWEQRLEGRPAERPPFVPGGWLARRGFELAPEEVTTWRAERNLTWPQRRAEAFRATTMEVAPPPRAVR